MPWQALPALPLAFQVFGQGSLREDLHGAIQRNRVEAVTIHHEELCVLGRVGLHVLAEPVREEDGIWVDFHRPIMILEATVLVAEVPHLQKGLRVQPRVCGGAVVQVADGLLDGRDDDGHDVQAVGANADDLRLSPVTEDLVLLALENARALGLLSLHKRELVAVHPHDLHAEERRPAPRRTRCGGERRAGAGCGTGSRSRSGRGRACEGRCCCRGCRSGGWVHLTCADGLHLVHDAIALVGLRGGHVKLAILHVAPLGTFVVTPLHGHLGVKVAKRKTSGLTASRVLDGEHARIGASAVDDFFVGDDALDQQWHAVLLDRHVASILLKFDPISLARSNDNLTLDLGADDIRSEGVLLTDVHEVANHFPLSVAIMRLRVGLPLFRALLFVALLDVSGCFFGPWPNLPCEVQI
mmetsp:Transcript_48158/g.133821  ORF Transcript_48158/g.133821 Transcript_48158/m.133821 type:complete len:412 (-) Transcript_48158:1705-2940(-)